MHKYDVIKELQRFGFIQIDNAIDKHYDFDFRNELLHFDTIFSDKYGREIYIIEEQNEKIFSKEAIYKIEENIKAFIYSRPNNDGIRYNINLVLLCPIDKKTQEYNDIVNLERDKYTCRKIFLDTECSNIEEEMSILPFIPISSYVNYDVSEMTNLSDEIKKITYNSDIVLNEMLAKVPILKNIEDELLKLSKGNGEGDDE